MKRLVVSGILLTVILGSGWAVYHREEIRSPNDLFRLAGMQLGSLTRGEAASRPPHRDGDTIRVASFNIQVFGESKSRKPGVLRDLARIVREFDLVAVQEIRNKDQSAVRLLIDEINSVGRDYGIAVSRRTGRPGHLEQYAFLYDQETIQLDMSQAYSVDDPDDLMRREPFVGWFRARAAPTEEAFTFSLVNLHLDSRTPEAEIQHLNQVFRAIRNDGRGEDDIIIAGDFNADDRQLQELGYRYGMNWIISLTPTNTRHSQQYDNLIIDPRATSEFTGRSGVFDFMSQFNLTLEQALQLSDHLPVWGEFSVREGGAGFSLLP